MTIPTRVLGRTGVEVLDGLSRHEFILRFTLSHPAMSSVIVGTSNAEHLRGNVAIASRGPLPHDVYAEARRRRRLGLGLAPA